MSQVKKYSAEFFKSLQKVNGALSIKVNDVAENFPLSHAAIRERDISLYFDMSEGSGFNSFIGLVINKDALSKKIELPSNSVYLLFQDPTAEPPQEWLASSGWVRVEWEESSGRIQGLMNFRGDNDDYAVLEDGKFDVTISP
ncbi:hypothetical protein [Pseudomonas sp. JL3]|uniref:hypothetical protein n=1 Tax=Pseudomonas sp. JL3 TaxID=2919943 RepID=UPI0028642EC9|nr:hypothetical protein [Pseudomonas sp. JL3]MDR8367163.1 hypothetical protein [Pseudomonas sp. JL3]